MTIEKVKATTLFLPHGANKVARNIGRKVKLFATKVRWPEEELSPYDLAGRVGAELGIHPKLAHEIIVGNLIPPQPLAKRIIQWVWEGKTFSDKPLSRNKTINLNKRLWKKVTITMTRNDWRRVSRAAKRINVTIDEVCAIFITRGLDNEPVITNLELAAKEIELARTKYVFQHIPEIERLFRGDLDLASGVWTEEKRTQPENTTTEATAVEEILQWDSLEEWEERFL